MTRKARKLLDQAIVERYEIATTSDDPAARERAFREIRELCAQDYSLSEIRIKRNEAITNCVLKALQIGVQGALGAGSIAVALFGYELEDHGIVSSTTLKNALSKCQKLGS